MSIVLDALRRERSRHSPEPVHPVRTDVILYTLGQRPVVEPASLVRVLVVPAGLIVAAGVLTVLLFVARLV